MILRCCCIESVCSPTLQFATCKSFPDRSGNATTHIINAHQRNGFIKANEKKAFVRVILSHVSKGEAQAVIALEYGIRKSTVEDLKKNEDKN